MIAVKDLTGHQFRHWTVVERAPNSSAGHSRWACKCDCGTKRIVLAKHLLTGKSLSCGCANRSEFGSFDVSARKPSVIQQIGIKLAELSALVGSLDP